MRAGKEAGLSDQDYVWQVGPSTVMYSGSALLVVTSFSGNQLQVSRKVVLEAHDIPRHGSGDPLEDRFRHTTRFHEFHGERPLDEAKWTFQSPWVRADAQCYSSMTRRALMIP